MLTAQEILTLIEDISITDDAVFSALKDGYLADTRDATGKIIPWSPEDLRDAEIVREKIISQDPRFFKNFIPM